MATDTISSSQAERAFAYQLLRYVPDLVRDEWVNIGVLVFDPQTGERRLRLIEDPSEFARVRRLHPRADESLLRGLRDDFEDRFSRAGEIFSGNGGSHTEGNGRADWLKLVEKWSDTLSNSLQLAQQKGTYANDLDAETERLYTDHVPSQRTPSRVGVPGTRAAMRSYCHQVWKQAKVWDRIQKSVRAAEWTFPGDPMRLDYAYRRNGTRGFVQTLSVSRAPGEVKSLAYTFERMRAKINSSEFTAITDVPLLAGNDRHSFVQEALRDARVETVPLEGFAVWVAKLRPLIQ